MRTIKATRILILFLAGLLPILAVSVSYLININHADVTSCNPFLSGCISISRAARSGPGLLLFKTLMLPAAVMLATSWVYIGIWARDYQLATDRMLRILLWLGLSGAAFMALYIINLGLDGTMYRFMRRFGITVFFGFTMINQLLLVRMLWPTKSRLPVAARQPLSWFVLIVGLEWLVGVGTTSKRLLISDPYIVGRVENIAEWWFALLLEIAFILLAWLLASIKSADD